MKLSVAKASIGLFDSLRWTLALVLSRLMSALGVSLLMTPAEGLRCLGPKR